MNASFLSAMRKETECRDIVVAADLHYISPSLTDGGAAFTELIGSGDGKVMHQIEALSDAFLDEVIERRPDALLLLGDRYETLGVAEAAFLAREPISLRASFSPLMIVSLII